MTDDKTQSDTNDGPDPATPKQSGQDAERPQADKSDAPAQPGQRAVPGRRPLFRS